MVIPNPNLELIDPFIHYVKKQSKTTHFRIFKIIMIHLIINKNLIIIVY
jgi:hypothetical protein